MATKTGGSAAPVKEKKSDDWKLTKTCHMCGKVGHIKPNCPDLKKTLEASINKFGALIRKDKEQQGPYLSVEMKGIEPYEGNVMRMIAYVDSGSEADSEHLVIGWESISQNDLLRQLQDLIKVQRWRGVPLSSCAACQKYRLGAQKVVTSPSPLHPLPFLKKLY